MLQGSGTSLQFSLQIYDEALARPKFGHSLQSFMTSRGMAATSFQLLEDGLSLGSPVPAPRCYTSGFMPHCFKGFRVYRVVHY